MNLDALVDSLNKKYGKTVIRKASELPPLRALPFMIPSLDLDMGGGALWGRTTVIAGEKGSGKTSLAYKLAAQAQKLGIPVFWFDLEKAFDPERAKVFGLNPENVLVVRGELTAENLFGILRDTIREVNKWEDTRAIFVVDSLALMVADALMDKPASEQFGGSARVINQSVTVWQIVLNENQILLEINELRSKMTLMGDPFMQPGGMAQEFIASSTIWTRAGAPLKEGTAAPHGQEIRWTVKKSRSSFPKEIGVVNYDYANGFIFPGDLIAVAVEMGIISQSGAWFNLPDGSKAHGMEKLIEKLTEDMEYMTGLQNLVYQAMPVQRWNGLDKVEKV